MKKSSCFLRWSHLLTHQLWCPLQVFSVGGASVVYVCVYPLNVVFPGNHGDLSLFDLSMCAVQAIQHQMCVAHSLPVSYR